MTQFPAYFIPILFLIVMVILSSIFAPGMFNVIHDPITWLGGQELDQAWIFNAGLIGFGAMIMTVTAGYYMKERFSSSIEYTLYVFGMSVLLMGIWRSDHSLINAMMDREEAREHMLFYGVAMGSIVLSLIIHIFLSQDKQLKRIHLMFMCFIGLTFGLFVWTHRFEGLIESLLWMMIFAWLILYLGRVKSDGYNP